MSFFTPGACFQTCMASKIHTRFQTWPLRNYVNITLIRTPPPPPTPPKKRFLKINFESLIFFWGGGGWEFVACEQQTHFRSSLLSLLAEAREATTGNASAVRRLEGLLFRFIVSKLGSRVPVSQRLIFTPSPPKNP